MIYATYYHPSNYATAGGDDNLSLMLTFGDGTTKVVGKKNSSHGVTDGHLSGGNYGAVDTTTFIIDFIPAAESLEDGNWGAMIEHTNYKGGFHAMVVNGGYDDNTTFGGAQIGNGAGVHWNGEINWF